MTYEWNCFRTSMFEEKKHRALQLCRQRFNLSLSVTGRDIRTRVLQLVVLGSGVTVVVSEQG